MSGLILTRKYDQALLIHVAGQDIWVTIIGVERDRVQLHIDAPAEVVILREELTKGKRDRRAG